MQESTRQAFNVVAKVSLRNLEGVRVNLVSRLSGVAAASVSLWIGACYDATTRLDSSQLALSGEALLGLSADQGGRLAVTPGGSFQIPNDPAVETLEPVHDTGLPTTIVDFRIKKPHASAADPEAKAGSFSEAVHVSVQVNSEVPRPAYRASDRETLTLEIGGEKVVLSGENFNCNPKSAPLPPAPANVLYRSLEDRLIARWAVGSQELHLSCARRVVAGRDKIYLNCGGGTDEQPFGRIDFDASEEGTGNCADALANLVAPLSFAPRIVDGWRRTDRP